MCLSSCWNVTPRHHILNGGYPHLAKPELRKKRKPMLNLKEMKYLDTTDFYKYK
jgi:hypothetical protein